MGDLSSLKTIKELDVSGKSVLVRLDLDVPVEPVASGGQRAVRVADDTRLVETLPTVKHLLDSGAKAIAIGHLGRPQVNFQFLDRQYSLEPIYEWYRDKLGNNPNFQMLENLRFNPGEEGNSREFAERLVKKTRAGVYVYEAFAAAHRRHASVVEIPKILPTVAGLHLKKELVHLGKVLDNPLRPVVAVVGGAKCETKLPLVEKLIGKMDLVLLGGKMPLEIFNFSRRTKSPTKSGQFSIFKDKIKLAELKPDKLDITENSAREFADIIMNAGTVVWNGPMGKYEIETEKRDRETEEKYQNTPAYGTYVIAKAVNKTKALTVAGGGDTEAALTKFGLEKGVGWISSGGGAMLYYLARETLPFLEAMGFK